MSLNPLVREDTDNTIDTLQTATLDRAVSATIETNILNPVTHQYDYTSGGSTTFRFPSSGVLDAPNCSLSFNPTSSDGKACFPLTSGGHALIDRCRLRIGGVIMSEVVNAGEYATMKNIHQSLGLQSSVLDIRHLSSNKFEEYIRPDLDSTKENCGAIVNVECDQASSWHKAVEATTNVVQPTKCLTDDKTTTAEVVLRLADLFPVFKDNKLPLFATAAVELEIEWLAAGAIADNPKSCVISSDQAALTNGVITLGSDQVRLNCDYIHYDDEEKAKIQAKVNEGMRLRFTEVAYTRGVNPETTTGTTSSSDHIIGFAGKEVQAVYIKKLFDVNSATGQTEKAQLGHNNAFLNQFRSQNMRGESYNFLINNFRVYSMDVKNAAEQHDYIAQIESSSFQPAPATYDTMDYNTNFSNILLNKVLDGGAGTAKSQTAWLGTQHYLGLNLKKFPEMGARFGNGTRIGTSPIQVQYSRVGAANNNAQVDLSFFIEYSRTLEITPLGVNVMDA